MDFNLRHLPELPADRNRGIAVCGAGGIVEGCHLPAYRKAGFRVAGIYDVRPEAARRLAALYEIPRVYRSLDELIDDPAAEIVDVAVPATETLPVVRRAAPAGKALLLQKPLAEDWETALATVAEIDRCGVRAAVNQQLRWMPAVHATRNLIERGELGDAYQIAFTIWVNTPWHMWEWLKQKPRMEVLYHSIHYLDAIRYLTGREPERLFSDGSTRPGYDAQGETRTLTHLMFGGELRATVLTNHHSAFGREGQRSEFRVEGTEGSVIGELGLLMNYPTGLPDSFRWTGRSLRSGCWASAEFAESWYPDAFVGPMASLMQALNGERERPLTDVHDNLNTMRLVFAAYASQRDRTVVSLTSPELAPNP